GGDDCDRTDLRRVRDGIPTWTRWRVQRMVGAPAVRKSTCCRVSSAARQRKYGTAEPLAQTADRATYRPNGGVRFCPLRRYNRLICDDDPAVSGAHHFQWL